MPASVFDSFYLKDRYGSPAMRAIWDDRAMIQRWLDVEGALALVEAELGIIPKTAAREIARKARVERLDLRAMRRDFDTSWNPVMPLVDALRRTLSPQRCESEGHRRAGSVGEHEARPGGGVRHAMIRSTSSATAASVIMATNSLIARSSRCNGSISVPCRVVISPARRAPRSPLSPPRADRRSAATDRDRRR